MNENVLWFPLVINKVKDPIMSFICKTSMRIVKQGRKTTVGYKHGRMNMDWSTKCNISLYILCWYICFLHIKSKTCLSRQCVVGNLHMELKPEMGRYHQFNDYQDTILECCNILTYWQSIFIFNTHLLCSKLHCRYLKMPDHNSQLKNI